MAETREERAQKELEPRTQHDKATDERTGVWDIIANWVFTGFIATTILGTIAAGSVIRAILRIMGKVNRKQREKNEMVNEDILVYVNPAGKRYHREGCQFLGENQKPMKLENARERYEPCRICDPPK